MINTTNGGHGETAAWLDGMFEACAEEWPDDEAGEPGRAYAERVFAFARDVDPDGYVRHGHVRVRLHTLTEKEFYRLLAVGLMVHDAAAGTYVFSAFARTEPGKKWLGDILRCP